MAASNEDDRPEEGARARKRRETQQKITDVSLSLFTANGYEATTIDAIAAEAGISRRTFFHYFKSKDDILLSLQAGLGESLIAALEQQPVGKAPFAAVRDAMMALASAYSTEDLVGLDKLMLSSEAVQARKQASYIGEEKKVFAALQSRWPDEPLAALRLIAMLSIGVTRISLDVWRDEGGTRPLVAVAEEIFAGLARIDAYRGLSE